ncbi:T9SS type A sorting domain-containing protein [Chryseobacterium camelliae]|uniref:T9SS type A sorting domain-containing protein n=1 Tax=Chryseobacterium camelliae TaxID=1265445 RepID=UPI000C1CA2AF|nr:T9SS type A sorting domain-containing protein [Chryseobacterium camelliae]
MNKTLLIALSLSASFSLSAQVLESDNYNSYNVGNLTTAVDGTTVGQGGMYAYGGTAANYQIVTGDATHAKYLQVTGGSDGTATSSRYVFKSGLATAWSNRVSGNNIIKGSVEIYTGTSTNKHSSGVSVVSATNGIVGIRYNSQTKTINGLAYLQVNGNPPSNGYYSITGLTTNTYPANTWIKVGYSYNKTTGAITYNIAGSSQTLAVTGASTVAGLDPSEFDVYSSPTVSSATDPANTGPTTFGIDNYVVEASSNATLATDDVKNTKTSVIAIGPNPAIDYLNILTEEKINAVEIFDVTGRKVPVALEGNRINVRDLNAGTYIISFETKAGKVSEKFIKK